MGVDVMQVMSGAGAARRPAGVRAAMPRAFFAAFRPWRLWDDREGGSPAARVARDASFAEAVGRGARPPTVRFWEGGRALVVARRERRLPRFAEAAGHLEAEGWPVVVRETGGTAFPHSPGVLHLSLAIPRAGAPVFSLETLYRALCAPLRLALRRMGLPTTLGPVPGSFCDGRFNVVAGGRKLAGTAQAWRGGLAGVGARRGYVLAHASLLVDLDAEAATEAVNRFYALAGGDCRFDPRASTTVRACLAATGDPRADGPPAKLAGQVRAELEAALTHYLGL